MMSWECSMYGGGMLMGSWLRNLREVHLLEVLGVDGRLKLN
jgi:hypothetical protein